MACGSMELCLFVLPFSPGRAKKGQTKGENLCSA